MPTSAKDIQAHYPLPAYRFKVEVYPYLGSLLTITAFGGKAWSFSEVSGLESHYDHQVYRDGMSFMLGIDLLRGIRQPVTITLRRGIVRDRKQLADWMQTEGLPWSDLERKKNLRIVQVDENGHPLVAWMAIGAMPVKLTGPQLKASDNDVAIEALELIAERLNVEYL